VDYHRLLNGGTGTARLVTVIRGKEVSFDVGSQPASLMAGEKEFNGVIYFFRDASEAERARQFMESTCRPALDQRIHIAYYTAEGPRFIR
jgi:hypothetical protein